MKIGRTFGRPGVRLPEKPASGLQYSCSDQEFRLFVLTTAAPIDREEERVGVRYVGDRYVNSGTS